MTTSKETKPDDRFAHLTEAEQAEAFRQIAELESSCVTKHEIMQRKHGEYNTAKDEYTKAVNNLRETIQSWIVPHPMFDQDKGKPESKSAKKTTKKKTAKTKVSKKKARRGGLDHPAVKNVTGQGK